MPNIMNFGFTAKDAAQIVVPTHEITATVYEGGETVADFTGPNALQWPQVLATFSAEQRQALMDSIAQTIVLMKAGLW